MRGHNTVEQNLMPDSWLILSPVAAPACGVHKNCKITFTPDGGAINVAKRGNKSESLPFFGIGHMCLRLNLAKNVSKPTLEAFMLEARHTK